MTLWGGGLGRYPLFVLYSHLVGIVITSSVPHPFEGCGPIASVLLLVMDSPAQDPPTGALPDGGTVIPVTTDVVGVAAAMITTAADLRNVCEYWTDVSGDFRYSLYPKLLSRRAHGWDAPSRDEKLSKWWEKGSIYQFSLVNRPTRPTRAFWSVCLPAVGVFIY